MVEQAEYREYYIRQMISPNKQPVPPFSKYRPASIDDFRRYFLKRADDAVACTILCRQAVPQPHAEPEDDDKTDRDAALR